MLKITIAIFLQILSSQIIFAQDEGVLINDSLKIFSKLNSTDKKVVVFGNKENGIERCYKFYSNRWNLNWICLYRNNVFVWCCKVGQYDKFEIKNRDLYNINPEIKRDSMDIHIPFESGETWLIIKIRNQAIAEIIRHTSKGNIIDEFEIEGNEACYKLYNASGKLKMLQQGVFSIGSGLIKGKEFIYDEKGNLIKENTIKRTKQVDM